jgi:hypothetical protein
LHVVSSTKAVDDAGVQPHSQPPPPSVIVALKHKDDIADTNKNDVPDLVIAQSARNDKSLPQAQSFNDVISDSRPEVMAIDRRNFDSMEHSRPVISIPGPVCTTIDDARHAVTLVSMYEQACAEQGRVCDHTAALQWAAQQQKSEKILNARREEELRRYLWDNAQRTVDRSLSQNQHDEKIALSREDKDWQKKLQACREKCHSALMCALYQCFVGTFIIVVSRPIILLIYFWSSLSGTDMVCYGTGTSLDPKVSLSTTPSWYGRYTLYAYADTWTSAILGETATCLAYAMGRATYVVAAIFSLKLATWLLKQLVVVELVQNLIKAAILLLVFTICGWVPEHLLYRILFCLGVIATACFVIVNLKFQSIRTEFRRMNTPPNASVVNKYLEWFDDAIGIIQIIPFVAFGCLILILVL